ncbi:hypothetical protein ABKV19_026518 [Rosa sericea]
MQDADQLLELKGRFIDIGSVNFQVTKESFMDHLSTYMHESYLKIETLLIFQFQKLLHQQNLGDFIKLALQQDKASSN